MIQVELQEVMGGDFSIASAAWTSSTEHLKKKPRTKEDIKRVVNMLADYKHSVPFESVVFRFWIKMPISTDRQHMTHRLQSASGISARYRTMPSEWADMPQDVIDILRKCYKNPNLADDFVTSFVKDYNTLCEQTNAFYRDVVDVVKTFEKQGKITNVEYKRVREKFRDVLPQGNMTERVTTINLRSLANYIKLRNSDHAQPEIRTVAKLMLEAVKNSGVCPVALEALERNGWSI